MGVISVDLGGKFHGSNPLTIGRQTFGTILSLPKQCNARKLRQAETNSVGIEEVESYERNYPLVLLKYLCYFLNLIFRK